YFLVAHGTKDLQRGFGVAQLELQGENVRTRFGHVVALSDLEEAHPANALGVEHLGVAWVAERGAGVWTQPDDSQPPPLRKQALEHVVLDERPAPAGWRSTRDGFMRESELRVPTLASRPNEVQPGERWIDVDTRQQILGVYDGDQP